MRRTLPKPNADAVRRFDRMRELHREKAHPEELLKLLAEMLDDVIDTLQTAGSDALERNSSQREVNRMQVFATINGCFRDLESTQNYPNEFDQLTVAISKKLASIHGLSDGTWLVPLMLAGMGGGLRGRFTLAVRSVLNSCTSAREAWDQVVQDFPSTIVPRTSHEILVT